jgi:4'-phosphopantetheinyl transferase
VTEVRRISPSLTLALLDLQAYALKEGILLKRELEKKGTSFLLQTLFAEETAISYLSSGKPVLTNRSEHISLSHSHGKLVLAVNTEENTGVDIELIREKVLRIRHKFVGEAEDHHFNTDDAESLTRVWAAKEAMYKAYGEKEIDFKSQLLVKPAGDTELQGKLLLRNGSVLEYLLHWERIDQHILVYVKKQL